ncbi:MAG: hypothetical protein IH935_03010, partial [Acidobacteria bacterium]|nr:hypothetical protein [Acidobacteriota bacterium]
FGAMDALLIRDMLAVILPVRLAIGAVYVLAIEAQVRRGVRTDILEFQCALGVVFGFAAWLIIAAQSRETTATLYYAGYGLIFMLVANLFFNLSFRFALLSSGLIAAGFLVWAIAFVRDTTYTVCFGSLYISNLAPTSTKRTARRCCRLTWFISEHCSPSFAGGNWPIRYGAPA